LEAALEDGHIEPEEASEIMQEATGLQAEQQAALGGMLESWVEADATPFQDPED
jgi:uncharacterized membrane protein YebE (DUF533 family)